MHEIAPHVYLEDRYPGVVVGLLHLARGSVLIDSPPCPDANRAWRTALRAFNGRGPERVLVYLDYQADHCLGGRNLSHTVVAHTYVGEMFQPRTNLFRGQTAGQGENWELCSNSQGMRWVPPNMLFDRGLAFYWDDAPVHLTHRPGPTPGSIWVAWAGARVVFVGDAGCTASRPSSRPRTWTCGARAWTTCVPTSRAGPWSAAATACWTGRPSTAFGPGSTPWRNACRPRPSSTHRPRPWPKTSPPSGSPGGLPRTRLEPRCSASA